MRVFKMKPNNIFSIYLLFYICKLTSGSSNRDVCDIDDLKCLNPNLDDLGDLVWGQCLHEGILRRIEQTTLLVCIKECIQTSGCDSFNFRPKWKMCDLTVRNATDLQSEAGCAHGSIDTWPQELAGNCAGHSCERGQRCSYSTDTQQTICNPSYCPSEPVTNAVVKEKFGLYRNIDRGTLYECIDGYRMVGTPYAVCRNQNGVGEWDILFSCMPEKCYEVQNKGYIYHEDLSLCFKFFPIPAEYVDAQAVCRKDGGELIRIENAEKNSFITSYVASLNLVETQIILIQGYNDLSLLMNWKFDDGTIMTYFNWGRGQPELTSITPPEMYICLFSEDQYTWHDFPSIQGTGFLCEINLTAP